MLNASDTAKFLQTRHINLAAWCHAHNLPYKTIWNWLRGRQRSLNLKTSMALENAIKETQ